MTEIKKLTFPASLCKQGADTWLCSASQTYPCGIFLLESNDITKMAMWDPFWQFRGDISFLSEMEMAEVRMAAYHT